jgi:hypothetical protein
MRSASSASRDGGDNASWRLGRARSKLARMKPVASVSLVALVLLSACGPSPDYVESPDASQAPPGPAVGPEARPADENPNCRMATPQTRLMGRMNGFRGIEGMNTLPCPLTPVVEAPPPGAR